jgi:hypothetical protein
MQVSQKALDAARRKHRLTTTVVVVIADVGYLAISGLSGSSVY